METRTSTLGRLCKFLFATGALGLVAVGTGAAASRDSGRAAYLVVARQPVGAIVVETLTARGRVLHVLGRVGQQWSGPPEWTPDHARAVWFGPRGVTIGAVDGGGQRVLTSIEPRGCKTNCIAQSFDLSPDGKSVLVDGVGPQGKELVAVSISTGRVRVLARGGADTDYSVSGGWSPDGRSILYVRVLNGDKPENDLMLAHADGKDARIVMRLRNPAEGPIVSWAPNGREIAFLEGSGSMSNGHTSVGVLDLTSGHIHTIRISTQSAWPPAWAPDSRRLALSGTYDRTFILTANGTPLRRFRFLADRLDWTRAGLYMLRGPQDTAVYRSSHAVQPPRLLFTQRRFGSIVSFVPR
jgi:WD40-like Beta Propeller Repeat